MKLLLATHNEHKRREFARLLEGHEVELAARRRGAAAGGRGDVCARTRSARPAQRRWRRARVSIADDSGIEAAALGGAPGVRSARYAGEHASDEENLAKLLREAPAGSALEYVCALAYVDPRRRRGARVRGPLHGHLAASTRGAGGFGYDPAFLPDDGWGTRPPIESPST